MLVCSGNACSLGLFLVKYLVCVFFYSQLIFRILWLSSIAWLQTISALTCKFPNSEVSKFTSVENPRSLFGNSCGLRIPAELRRERNSISVATTACRSLYCCWCWSVSPHDSAPARLRLQGRIFHSRHLATPPLSLDNRRRRKPSRAAHCCTSLWPMSLTLCLRPAVYRQGEQSLRRLGRSTLDPFSAARAGTTRHLDSST